MIPIVIIRIKIQVVACAVCGLWERRIPTLPSTLTEYKKKHSSRLALPPWPPFHPPPIFAPDGISLHTHTSRNISSSPFGRRSFSCLSLYVDIDYIDAVCVSCVCVGVFEPGNGGWHSFTRGCKTSHRRERSSCVADL